MSKQIYYSQIAKKLIYLSTKSKHYWSVMKTSMNNKNIPCISPIFHKNKLITELKPKADIFNDFLATRCTLVEKTNTFPPVFESRTRQSLSKIDFTSSDVNKIIKNIDSNKKLTVIWLVFAWCDYAGFFLQTSRTFLQILSHKRQIYF